MSLFVLKNNPAFRFYRQHGFDVVQETSTKFVMRRASAEAAYGNEKKPVSHEQRQDTLMCPELHRARPGRLPINCNA